MRGQHQLNVTPVNNRCISVWVINTNFLLRAISANSTYEKRDSKENFELMCPQFGMTPMEYLLDNSSSFTSCNSVKCWLLPSNHLLCLHKYPSSQWQCRAHNPNHPEDSMHNYATLTQHYAGPKALRSMAVQHAVYLHNHVPDPVTRLAPINILSMVHWHQNCLLISGSAQSMS